MMVTRQVCSIKYDLYSRGIRFESRAGYCLYLLRCSRFSSAVKSVCHGNALTYNPLNYLGFLQVMHKIMTTHPKNITSAVAVDISSSNYYNIIILIIEVKFKVVPVFRHHFMKDYGEWR
jgi:hypothetical protein